MIKVIDIGFDTLRCVFKLSFDLIGIPENLFFFCRLIMFLTDAESKYFLISGF